MKKFFSVALVAIVLLLAFGGYTKSPEPKYDKTEIKVIEVNGDDVYYIKDNTGNYYCFSWTNAEEEFEKGSVRTLITYEGSEENTDIW